jgi:hypothetical protein
MKRTATLKRAATAAGVAVTAFAAIGAVAFSGNALIAPGTPAKDVHVGLDNDNADNEFIQPPGVTAKQHMDKTDVLFGRENADLLIGKLGSDTLLAGEGPDILVGGPERGSVDPNSDVLVGEEGRDINIWAPGDGSEAFIGNEGHDTMVFAPFVLRDNGNLKLERFEGRKIPRVDIDGQAGITCEIVRVPASERLGAQFLARFLVNDNLIVTVRQKDVEQVLCTSPREGWATVADLSERHPQFRNVRLNHIPGVLGAIVASPTA